MFMRVGALCAVIERIRRVFVFFRDFPTFRAFLRTFAHDMRPFFDLCLTFLVQKPLLRAYISMLLDCSYFPFLFALGLENYGG